MLWKIFVYVSTYIALFNGIFFLYTFFENLRHVKNKKAKKYPFVSIMVPAFNEEKTLRGTMYSLLSLDYPKDKIEFFIINDGSTDNTLKVAKEFESRGVKVYTKENQGGKGYALNFGLKKCRGEFVGCLDADSFVRSQALKKMVGYFEDPNIMAVTPSLKVCEDKTILQKIQKIEYLMGVFLRKVFAYLDSVHVTPGPFTIYRKSFFDEHGGYDEDNLTEDIEVALRIQRKGYRIENCIDANVYTISPSKIRPLFRQRMRWYVGFLNNILDYKDLFGFKHGNLGMYVLPSAFISIGTGITLFFYSLGKLIFNSIDGVFNFALINSDFEMGSFLGSLHMDSFYLTTFNTMNFLAIFSLVLGITILLLTKYYSKEEENVNLSYVLFIFLYWVLFSFLWTSSFIHKLFKVNVGWR